MGSPDDRTIHRTTTERDEIAFWAGAALIVVAFAGSYTHVVTTVDQHGQHGWIAYVIAAMPELAVGLGMRTLVTGRGRTVAAWANLTAGAAFTLAANVAQAEPTWPGRLIAAWPAVAAALAMWVAGGHTVADPVAGVAAKATPRPRKVAEATRPAVQHVADVAPPVARSGLVVAEATQATVRAAWEATGRAMTDQEIAEALGVTKAAARSRRRSWDGSKASPARASQVDAR